MLAATRSFRVLRFFATPSLGNFNANGRRFVSKGQADVEPEKPSYFGYEKVTEEEKTQKVLEVFKNVAAKYDVMNDVMSGGIHRYWKDSFVSTLDPVSSAKCLDVAGGTGDIAFRIVRHMQERSNQGTSDPLEPVVVYDINQSMLDVGRARAEAQGLSPHLQWVQGDAATLPFEDDAFDAYTIAFGIRNVTKIEQALKEAFRVLKPGGRFLCLEFSHVEYFPLKWLYDQYSFQLIPVMGQLIAGDWKSYQYLVESIRQFYTQEDFKKLIISTGFKHVTYTNLMGGIACIHSGFKLS